MQSLKFLIAFSALAFVHCQTPVPVSITTASGTRAPPRGFRSGDLIFEDNFHELDFETWQHENTLAGGGNWEFQWYTNNRTNSFVDNGTLHIKPTIMADEFGEAFLSSGVLNVHGGAPADECTNAQFWGCERAGNPTNFINPIKSARLRTVHSFAFKYGTVEVRAKLPAGDWLWPAIWMMPKVNAYGTWPASGEIDLMEGRGNRNLFNGNVNVGAEQVGHTVHFGPRWDLNGWPTAHFTHNQQPGFNERFHNYRLVWTPQNMTFFVDDVQTGLIEAGTGFWNRGGWQNSGRENPWARATPMAPFDQEFYIIMNLAAGGVNYFADNLENRGGPNKPWSNDSPAAARDFWNGRAGWRPTWNEQTTDSHLQVEHVRVWAL